MRFSKIFLPLALAASAIAAGSAATAGSDDSLIHQKGTEIISLINSFSPDNGAPSKDDPIAARIASDLRDFVRIGVDLFTREQPCDGQDVTLFIETANLILNTIIMQSSDRIAPLSPLIAPILLKWDRFLTSSGIWIADNAQQQCSHEEIIRLYELGKHVKQAEQFLDIEPSNTDHLP